ncbi:Sigma 54 modulation/S30EA ribosomal protein C terminus [Acididesulfobacillus acetoxydans]|uniref:Ribosome hibernation promoting factor n=1 Tax=Acididesulfobacillus acetoxydans TaxID=1561005 RepID=A0A8S0XUT2_9FIRM|nr:ribosome-associated translation inhibitor RaiA [Acididesulfobacillus acetoxydans]CAA7599707.1 Sigma 54 modulation/S30EA ribosomal protein C terminus [Acididesulfobacillus acetoxydans]CEJ06259.1 Ribosome-associated factor Y [Acididesulfobacillus acetoxydans]
MNILIRGKHIEVTDALKDYVTKRVSKLEKYSDEFQDVQVTLLVEKDRHRVEVTAPINGMILRGEEETSDMYQSIDMVLEKLERQIDKYRTRINKRLRTKVLKDHEPEHPAAEEEHEHVVRNKKFQAKPMSVDEAIMQMNLIGHTFFVFTDADTHQMNVVYRRKNGDYGLLEPER